MRSAVYRTVAIRRLGTGLAALYAMLIALLWLDANLAPVSMFANFALLLPLLVFVLIAVKPEAGQLRRSGSRVLILGRNRLAGTLHRELESQVDRTRPKLSLTQPYRPFASATELDDPEYLKEFILREGVSQVVITEPDLENRTEFASMLIECKFRGVQIQHAPDFYEELNKKVWLEALWPGWFMFSDGFQLSKPKQVLKRTFDIFFAVAFLVLLAPLMLLIAAVVKLDSPGPVLFKQVRIGQFGTPFTLYKFRSMREDAENDTGPVWASDHDDRATFVGAILRRTHLDELPQILNVLRNEISFVGPRPERPEFVKRLEEQIPFYQLRHYVKPGITGWAQVSFPYGDSVEASYEKLQYDLYYARHASLCFEAKVLLATVKQVLLGRGR
jgi:exopolysaccharide biosynthesis polyprenyl glycosylphosphotransferase